MSIQHWSDNIWLAQLADEPALSEDLIALKDQAAARQPTPALVLDFSAVRQLNSSNISQLLRLRKLMVDCQTRLLLAAVRDPLWVVFLTTGLDKVFEFTADVPTALATLQMKAR